MRFRIRSLAALLLSGGLCLGVTSLAAQESADEPSGTVRIGGKNFTESNVLGEIVAQMLEERTGLKVEREFNLGGTMVCFGALQGGDIDCYCDYTGTAWSIILKEAEPAPDPLRTYVHVARSYRERYGLTWLWPFGLDNTYRLAVREDVAERLSLRTISDLVAHDGELSAGFSVEFNGREDGWPGLRDTYGLEFGSLRSMEHGLAYQAIAEGELDVIDAYATDGKLLRYPLRLLEDDKGFFPPYQAAPVFRSQTLERFPEIEPALADLALILPDERMQALNDKVEHDGWSLERTAAWFLADVGLAGARDLGAAPTVARDRRSFFSVMGERVGITLELAWEHLLLTITAVVLAALVAIPMGILATRFALFRQIALAAAGIVQTIPSLAMLAFMIPLPGFGLSAQSAIAALFLYAILPILRNTYAGITEVDANLIEAARGLGFRDREILWRVQLPLASRLILAGVRTSTVIGIGVATLAAFIGGGGLGEPITDGLYLNDVNLILAGAVPAALLALLADLGLGLIERRLTPAAAN